MYFPDFTSHPGASQESGRKSLCFPHLGWTPAAICLWLGFGLCSLLGPGPSSQLMRDGPASQDSARCQLCCQAGDTLPSALSTCLSASSHNLLVLVLRRPQYPLNWLLLPAMHGLYMPGLSPLCEQRGRNTRCQYPS